MQQLKTWIVIKKSTNLALNESDLEWRMNMKKLTHSHQQPEAPKTHKRSRQLDKQSEQCSVPPKGPFLTDSWSWMKSSARHKLRNQQVQPETCLRLVNIIEN